MIRLRFSSVGRKKLNKIGPVNHTTQISFLFLLGLIFYCKLPFFIIHSLEVLLTGADVGLVAVHSHVYQFGQVSHSVCRQTERGVLDGGDVSVPQDA